MDLGGIPRTYGLDLLSGLDFERTGPVEEGAGPLIRSSREAIVVRRDEEETNKRCVKRQHWQWHRCWAYCQCGNIPARVAVSSLFF